MSEYYTPGFLAAGLRCPMRDLATLGSAIYMNNQFDRLCWTPNKYYNLPEQVGY